MDKIFKIGDVVRIRRWDDMVNQYGIENYDEIPCKFTFVEGMKNLCGQMAIIREVNSSGRVYLDFINHVSNARDWSYSTDMIEIVK